MPQAGFILDGYPRNLAQAAALDELLAKIGQPLDAVVKLEVPNQAIVERCELRFAAEGRADDNPDTVRRRLGIYAEQTAPVADFYARRGKLQVVDGVGDLDEVTLARQARAGRRLGGRGQLSRRSPFAGSDVHRRRRRKPAAVVVSGPASARDISCPRRGR